MADRGAQSTPFTTQFTDFDDALIKRGICSREQCLLAKGMSEDQVLDTLVAEEVELQTRAAEDTLRASLLDRELNPERVREEVAATATAQQLDELEEDDAFCDDAFLAKYREQRISELKDKQKMPKTWRGPGNTTGPVDAGDQCFIESILGLRAPLRGPR